MSTTGSCLSIGTANPPHILQFRSNLHNPPSPLTTSTQIEPSKSDCPQLSTLPTLKKHPLTPHPHKMDYQGTPIGSTNQGMKVRHPSPHLSRTTKPLTTTPEHNRPRHLQSHHRRRRRCSLRFARRGIPTQRWRLRLEPRGRAVWHQGLKLDLRQHRHQRRDHSLASARRRRARGQVCLERDCRRNARAGRGQVC